MPLARFAMHDQQELIHVAQWPTVKEILLVASRSYAFEGQCFVIAAGTALQKQDLAHLNLALFDEILGEPETLLMRGGSAIIAPNGDILAGPAPAEPLFITAEIAPQKAIDGRLTLDVTGHYARPDLFQLQVDTTEKTNVVLKGSG